MKIQIKNKGFPTTHHGYLEANKEYDLPDQFAIWCVDKMRSADYVIEPQKPARKKRAKNVDA